MAKMAGMARTHGPLTGTLLLLGLTGCAWWRAGPRTEPMPAARPSAAPEALGVGYQTAAPVLRVETTAGTFRIALRTAEAPRLSRTFLDLVADGGLVREGFWLTRPEVVQLGSPMTDVDDGGAINARSGTPWSLPPRDPVASTFFGTYDAHGFEFTNLPRIAGSVMIRQRFTAGGTLLRREYFIALEPGVQRGQVFAQVITGLDVVRRLNGRDAILAVRLE